MIAARTRGAGTKALDDNRAMLENEALRIKQFEEKKVRGRGAVRGGKGEKVRDGKGGKAGFLPPAGMLMIACLPSLRIVRLRPGRTLSVTRGSGRSRSCCRPAR